MDKQLFKAFKSYHKHRKDYQDKLDVFTRYLDGIEHEMGLGRQPSKHVESPEEKQMAQQADKTLSNIQKLLKALE